MSSDVTTTTVRIWSGLAVRGAFEGGIIADYEARTGNRIAVEWLPTTLIMERARDDGAVDILVGIRESVDQLIADGRIDPATRVEVAHSRLGLAVAGGAAHPPIATLDEFRNSLLAARSIAYSRAGASGIHFETVIEQLGIAAEVRSRATVIPAGFTAEKLVTGEADLAVQQVSELLVVPGIELVGKFPEALQKVSSFSAGVMPGSKNRAAAEAFLASLNDPRFHAAYRDSGVDPAV
ncbi:substrate-binding domain-containing protein [Roseomonas sp. 18066]|uniref:molybdate ABC transporter substrate-binding protein n=1 Tax=Roseomonas sp. 18066 TaxID=2681412 RepID=UPI00135CED4E|nr:substrate-binding domain-containing protein [Roseomonas sp. 18066]